MTREQLIELLDEILALLARSTDGAKGGISEQRRQIIQRLVKQVRDEIASQS